MIGLSVVGGLAILLGIVWAVESVQAQRLYRQKIGLDLAGLVALLPPELRGKRYYGFRLAPRQQGRISVGVCYHGEGLLQGNPPNVGLDFDPHTGGLLQVHPEGIGLGLK